MVLPLLPEVLLRGGLLGLVVRRVVPDASPPPLVLIGQYVNLCVCLCSCFLCALVNSAPPTPPTTAELSCELRVYHMLRHALLISVRAFICIYYMYYTYKAYVQVLHVLHL